MHLEQNLRLKKAIVQPSDPYTARKYGPSLKTSLPDMLAFTELPRSLSESLALVRQSKRSFDDWSNSEVSLWSTMDQVYKNSKSLNKNGRGSVGTDTGGSQATSTRGWLPFLGVQPTLDTHLQPPFFQWYPLTRAHYQAPTHLLRTSRRTGAYCLL